MSYYRNIEPFQSQDRTLPSERRPRRPESQTERETFRDEEQAYPPERSRATTTRSDHYAREYAYRPNRERQQPGSTGYETDPYLPRREQPHASFSSSRTQSSRYSDTNSGRYERRRAERDRVSRIRNAAPAPSDPRSERAPAFEAQTETLEQVSVPEVRRPPPRSTDRAMIAVFGMTGTGKTTLIQTLSGKRLKVGHGLQSCKIHCRSIIDLKCS
jgi:flagellar biosynthesis GTPase FlhF